MYIFSKNLRSEASAPCLRHWRQIRKK